MKKSKKIFGIINITMVVLLFIFTCVSLVLAAILGLNDSKVDTVNIVFALVYLVMHLIIVAVVMYLTINGLKYGGKFLEGFMLEEKSLFINVKAVVFSIILSIIGLALFIYFGLLALGVIATGASYFNIGLKLCLVNAGLGLFVGGATFAVYPFIFGNKEER